MKKITLANYRQDRHYARIVKATEDLLREKGFVAPVDLFIRMDLLSPKSVEDWRRGRIPYLERLIRCNLSKASRILRILQMHAHDLDLKPVPTVYKRWTTGPRTLLWFSKTGDRHVEDAYARHFFSPSKETHLAGGDRRSVARASHDLFLSDVDIAVELEGKWDSDEERDRHEKERIKFAFASGRTFSNFIDVLSWPKYEVLRYLKARTRGLSIHPLDDFIRMQKDKNFACRVLRGDADRVGGPAWGRPFGSATVGEFCATRPARIRLFISKTHPSARRHPAVRGQREHD